MFDLRPRKLAILVRIDGVELAVHFGDELGAPDNSRQDKNGRPVFVAATDWRCTTKPGKLYITLFKWPAAAFEVSKVKGKVTKAYLLADKKSLKVSQTADKVSVALSSAAPGEIASVLVLETAGN